MSTTTKSTSASTTRRYVPTLVLILDDHAESEHVGPGDVLVDLAVTLNGRFAGAESHSNAEAHSALVIARQVEHNFYPRFEFRGGSEVTFSQVVNNAKDDLKMLTHGTQVDVVSFWNEDAYAKRVNDDMDLDSVAR